MLSKVALLLLAALVLLISGGCGRWVNYGNPSANYNFDNNECENEAVRTYPPNFLTTDTSIDCSSQVYGHSDCFSNSAIITGSQENKKDVNLYNRQNAKAECLNARGWECVKKD
jgi:hypothetical protein